MGIEPVIVILTPIEAKVLAASMTHLSKVIKEPEALAELDAIYTKIRRAYDPTYNRAVINSIP